ncbi:hypothetical protein WJ0W_001792 [Paenibacillus melissococcoides]|uniref:DUF1795 domain-containing protein n=1 Tax=Paenibacillus melissococcoides TaxID=2912268 RepID=A0ABN8U4E4_9BACL|nr:MULTISPECIES: hypothetical protein [Paenibacillus]MEB9892336.1 hypothetical protein [Bacillus cereus]CAH8244558.1 hypothetical protein WJ0W_001792 [Paenibacillus melissococcoides]CAH8708339.1 hypothetical protein WDD9_001879 [Paenibacillus melissococcoides]CAH8709047.1 hypothetical protein HTL2_002164 [Paenibacillus melissococcoides]GIO78401.1 hypothetical protein J6TS7_20110 [Paenibacillus dendritiformis]
MEHVDEQIISLLYGEQENKEQADDKQNGTQSDQPILFHQAVLKINGETIPFTEERLLNGKIRVLLPKTFHQMSPQAAAMKYPSERRPELIYTNDNASINIAFNHTEHNVMEAEIEEFTVSMIHILRRMQPILQWYEDGVKDIHGKRVGYCEFLAPSLNVNVYNLMFFAELEQTALLCTFNCSEEEMKHWQPIARGLMDSLVIGELEEGRTQQ